MNAAAPTSPPRTATIYRLHGEALTPPAAVKPSPPPQPALTPEAVADLRRRVRHDKALSHQAKTLFEDICDLAAKTGHCHAGDAHFEKTYGVQRRTVRRWMKELRDAGYVAAEGATNLRMLTPADPQLRTRGDLSGTELRTRGDLSDPQLRTHRAPNLGQVVHDTKSINTPLRGGEARAREARTREGAADGLAGEGFDPVSIYRAAYPDVRLSIHQEHQLRTFCTDPAAFRAAMDYWLGNDHLGKSVWKFIDRYRRLVAGEVTEGGLPVERAAGGKGGVPDLSAPMTKEQRDAFIRLHPDLSPADFYEAGKDPKTGLDLFVLFPEKRTALAAAHA